MRYAPLAFCFFACGLHATVWQVGPNLNYTSPSQVSTLVNDGDTVDIAAGIYPADVARWQANDLLLRGVGGLAHLESNGMAWGGKAIWVIQGNNTTVEWLEFSECAVPDENGAGIRLEGVGLTVRHCYFHHNENGILAGELHPCTMRIERSEFAFNGFGDGFSHNLYIGAIDSLIFRFNYCHHAIVGHELKSRAWVNVIEYNRFSNEADGNASREIDLPNGGQAYLIGNVIHQGVQSENSNIVGFGMEGTSNPGPQELYAIENTLVNEKATGTFFQAPADVFFKAYGNILAGAGSFMSAWPTTVDALGNLRTTDISSVGFTDATNYDYHITTSSPAHSVAYPAGVATTGYPLVAWDEYVHPTNSITRCQHATLDAGAFETCTTTGVNEQEDLMLGVFPNPSSDQLSIIFPTDAVPFSIEIRDAQGGLLRSMNVNEQQSMTLDVRDLSAGVYLLRIIGVVESTQRFILY